MKFYFLRHPETIANKQGLIYGWKDYDYTEKGQQMLEAMPEKLDGLKFDCIYTSPLGRARRLAEAIAERRGMEAIADERIKEMNFGILEGMDFFTAKETHGEIMEKMFTDYEEFQVPEGESSKMVKERAISFLDETKNDSGSCLVVTHAMFIHTAMSCLLEFDPRSMWRFRLDPCTVVCVDFREGYGLLKSMIPFEDTDNFFIIDPK